MPALIFATPTQDHQASWSSADSQAFFGQHLPLSDSGKINIPANIKHVKLDIGLSWCAPMSQVWLAKEDDLIVFGFEPHPKSIASIKNGSCVPDAWARDYLDPLHPIRHKSEIPKLFGTHFFLIPCALGLSQDKTATFYLTGNDCGCSSLFAPVTIPVIDIIEVPVLPLASFFDIFPFDTHPFIDYIKIDAQGADLDIAKSAGAYLTERVVCITLEPENNAYEGTKNSLNDVDAYMSAMGFQKYDSKNTGDPTYVNIKFMQYFLDHQELHIFQQG